jgi:hypothetical protein
MQELSKSIQRRLNDSNFVARYFVGEGIDIGAGPDPLNLYVELFPLITSVRDWDVKDGDAELMTGCDNARYDFVHSSHYPKSRYCTEKLDEDLKPRRPFGCFNPRRGHV